MIPEDNTHRPDIETPFSFPLSTEALDSISHSWPLYILDTRSFYLRIPAASTICNFQPQRTILLSHRQLNFETF